MSVGHVEGIELLEGIRQLGDDHGIIIADEIDGDFALEVDWIDVCS